MSFEPGNNVRRREWITKGADPTVVVEWTIVFNLDGGSIEVTEFQNVYAGCHNMPLMEGSQYPSAYDIKPEVAEHIHKALEEQWQRAQERAEEYCDACKQHRPCLCDEMEEAERKAGWDPNP